MDGDPRRLTDGGAPEPTVPDTAENRLVGRRDAAEHSESGLLSRDYQPRHGGPELVASWPLGPAPGQTAPGDVDWTVESEEFVTLQRNLTVTQFLGPIDYTKLYAGVRGRCRVSSGATLTLRLRPVHLEGEAYETTVDLVNETDEPFVTPMVEVAPDDRDAYRDHAFIGRETYGGYVLSAKASGGTGHLDQGTAVHLWSE